MENVDISRKKIIVADLDGTLAESKIKVDREMGEIINSLLKHVDFAVISGGSYKQLLKQFVEGIELDRDAVSRLYILPTSGSEMYRFADGAWEAVYSEKLSGSEKKRIFDAFMTVEKEGLYVRPDKTYGVVIEDRDTQITLSGVGQDAPMEEKAMWDPDAKKRIRIKERLDTLLPEFEVRMGGKSSVDVTRKGIDKAYGIRKINERLGYGIEDMIFIGDALFEGGNDYPVKKCGVYCISVSSVTESKSILRGFLQNLCRPRKSLP